jgi:hypothetical protein
MGRSEPSDRQIVEMENAVLAEVEKELRNTHGKKLRINSFDYSKLHIPELGLPKNLMQFIPFTLEKSFQTYSSIWYFLNNPEADLEGREEESVSLKIYPSPVKQLFTN